jgi:hypothetical protein
MLYNFISYVYAFSQSSHSMTINLSIMRRRDGIVVYKREICVTHNDPPSFSIHLQHSTDPDFYFSLHLSLHIGSLLMNFAIRYYAESHVFFYISLIIALLVYLDVHFYAHTLLWLLPASFFVLFYYRYSYFLVLAIAKHLWIHRGGACVEKNFLRVHFLSIISGAELEIVFLLMWFILCGILYHLYVDDDEKVFKRFVLKI